MTPRGRTRWGRAWSSRCAPASMSRCGPRRRRPPISFCPIRAGPSKKRVSGGEIIMSKASWTAGAALLALAVVGPASAQQTVKVGAVYPLSGNSASTGNYAKMAFEMGADLINNGNPDLAKIFPLAKGGGLPGLKGAKIQMVIADNQGTPQA